MSSQPRALLVPRKGLLSRLVANEYLVLDETSGKVHELIGDTALVWAAATEGTWPALPDNEVLDIAASLVDLNLLIDTPGISRRRLIARAGVLSAVGVVTIALTEMPAFASSLLATVTTIIIFTPASPKQNHAFTASVTVVTSPGGANVRSGTVQLTNGAIVLGTERAPVVNGVASLSVPNGIAKKGTYTPTASYIADPTVGTYSASQGTKSITIIP